MNCYNEEIKLDAFKEKTTYLNDYKRYCNIKKEDLRLQQIRSESPSTPPQKRQYEDHETFAKWRDEVYIPFDLLHYPKPIIHTDPRKPFEKLAPLPEGDKLKAMKTRPRIYMTPACSMDDVPDPEMRRLLCDYMYTTEGRKAEIEGASGFKPKIPNISKINSTDTVSLQTDLYPPLQEKFIARSKKWDDEQIRGMSDPTKDFWIYKDPPMVCGACVNPLQNIVPQDTKNEIAKAINHDRLRLAHDIPSSSYAGYKPLLAMGVTISRKDLRTNHPLLTTSQAITSRKIYRKWKHNVIVIGYLKISASKSFKA